MSSTFTRASVATEADFRNAEQMAVGSRMDGTFRICEGDTHKALIEQMAVDGDPSAMVRAFYLRKVEEIRRGTHTPLKLRSFASVVTHFERWLTDRVPENEKVAIRNEGDKHVWMNFIPVAYRIPHPTTAEVDEFQSRWNNDGDLLAKVKGLVKLPGWVFLPIVMFEATNPHSTVMMTLMMMRENTELSAPTTTNRRART
jgi:hypothetical protein